MVGADPSGQGCIQENVCSICEQDQYCGPTQQQSLRAVPQKLVCRKPKKYSDYACAKQRGGGRCAEKNREHIGSQPERSTSTEGKGPRIASLKLSSAAPDQPIRAEQETISGSNKQ